MGLQLCNTVIDENGMEIKTHGTISFSAACYQNNVLKKPVPWHWHEEFEAAFVMEGSAFVSIGEEKVLLGRGQGIWFNTGALHQITADGKEDCVLKTICWHPRLVGGRDDSVYWQNYTKSFLAEHTIRYLPFQRVENFASELLVYFLDAWEKCVKEREGYELDVRYDLSKFLYYIQKEWEHAGIRRTEKELRAETRLKSMIGFIREHYGEQVTIGEIADAAMISVSECLRCFNRILGITPIRFLRQIRLEKAAAFLKMGKSVSSCCDLCGFEDMSYFAREFKKQYGCKPTEYKKGIW